MAQWEKVPEDLMHCGVHKDHQESADHLVRMSLCPNLSFTEVTTKAPNGRPVGLKGHYPSHACSFNGLQRSFAIVTSSSSQLLSPRLALRLPVNNCSPLRSASPAGRVHYELPCHCGEICLSLSLCLRFEKVECYH